MHTAVDDGKCATFGNKGALVKFASGKLGLARGYWRIIKMNCKAEGPFQTRAEAEKEK